ncbi:dolichol monophosphate mannose synthase [Nanoarchaeota archaeon]
MVELSIIIPTLNEKDNIKELIDRIKNNLKDIDYEIIFVDDGSNDGTIEEINKYKNNNIILIERGRKKGLGSAFLDGLKVSRGKYVVLMDSDLQHPPELLKTMYEKVKDYDIIIASRYVKGGKIEDWSLIRKIISKSAIFLSHLLLPETKKIKDTMSGYFIIRKDLLNNFNITDPFEYKVLLDILVKIKPEKILEIPYSFKERKKGKSKLNKKIIFIYLKQIIKLFSWGQFLKFSIVGLSGIFVNLFSLYLLYIFLPFYISSFLAIFISIIWNFIWSDIWIFREERKYKSFWRRFLEFTGGRGLLSKPVQYFSSLLFYYIFGINYIISQLLGIIISSIINWIWTKNYVYSR